MAVATIRAALAGGCSFFDTADVYCSDHDELHYTERLLREALSTAPRRVVISTKGGCRRRGEGSESSSWDFHYKITPEGVRSAMAASREACGSQHTLLWTLHAAEHFKADCAYHGIRLRILRLVFGSGVRLSVRGSSGRWSVFWRAAGDTRSSALGTLRYVRIGRETYRRCESTKRKSILWSQVTCHDDRSAQWRLLLEKSPENTHPISNLSAASRAFWGKF